MRQVPSGILATARAELRGNGGNFEFDPDADQGMTCLICLNPVFLIVNEDGGVVGGAQPSAEQAAAAGR